MILQFLKRKKNMPIFLVLIGGVLCGATVGTFIALTHDLPQIRSLETFRPSAVTRIYSADKVLLAELFMEKRDPVSLAFIPDDLRAALLNTEDRNFYKHSGVDMRGILRAMLHNIRAKRFVEGASTITQQLAKTLFLTPRKALMRKIREVILAFQLERRYTKDEILELYLNQIYLGSGAYGVESAAKIFFGKSVRDLNLAECALIAAMPRSPSRYSPLVNRELAIKRRSIVLKQMRVRGIITESAYQDALNVPVHAVRQDKVSASAPWFVEYVRATLEEALGSAMLYKEGLTVFTTLSSEMQQAADTIVRNRLYELEARMARNRIRNPDPECALISLDVASGGILAMTGGKDFQKSSFNRAVSAKRQPGSAFKPVIYAHAIEQGFSQNRLILDAPVFFRGGKHGKNWRPRNFSGKYQGEIPLRKALAISQNIPAVKLMEMSGPSPVVCFAHALGIESELSPNLSLALGTSEVTLMELSGAYSVFPNRGKWIRPFGILEVTDSKGRVVWRAKPEKRMVMSRAGAAIMSNMLEAVVSEGTARKAKVLQRPVAGKTGTSNAFKDALFIGFSPTITTGVWVGQDSAKSLGKGETGSKAALPIWTDFMAAALKGKAIRYFDLPDDVVQVRMNSETGKLASDDDPYGVMAFFKKGTEPKKKEGGQ